MDKIPQRGILSAITVPGMVDAWWQVWEKYGKLPWAKLLGSSDCLCGKGFSDFAQFAFLDAQG